MRLTLLGSALSPFVRKARVTLLEKGLEHRVEPVVPFLAPDSFSRTSPLRRVPVLRDAAVGTDWALPDSSAICAYLERAFPTPALYPRTAEAYARALWIEEFADTEFSHTIGQGIFRPALVQVLLGEAPDRARAEQTFEEDLPPYLDYLESILPASGPFLENAFGIADISVAVHLQNLRLAGFELDPDHYPKLRRLLERAMRRESFALCQQDAEAMLAEHGAR